MRKTKAPSSRAKATHRRPPPAAESAARMKSLIPASDLSLHLERMPRFPLYQLSVPPPPSRFQRKLLEASDGFDSLSSLDDGGEEVGGDKDCILSQDFFCTPDYITPEIPNNLNPNKENIACPKSPEKSIRNKRQRQGGRGNHRLKFSFRSLSNKGSFSRDCSLSKDETYNSCEEDIEGPAEWDYFEHGTEEDAVPQLLENILEESAELAKKPGFHKQLVGIPSVTEMLEDMQKTDPSLRRTLALDNIKGKERQTSSSKRTLLHLGNRVLDNKDASEFTGDISSEDEHIDQDHRTAQIVKGQTMADLFQEAFIASTDERAEIPRSNKFVFHGRLQYVIQLEKDRHMEYLKERQTGRTPSNESNCINARILSRTLEAKLTVCQCLFDKSCKGLREGFGNGGTKKKTIIFSPKFCSNVELEVGGIVCIHPPWKEVQVNGGEPIILSTYFSPPL